MDESRRYQQVLREMHPDTVKRLIWPEGDRNMAELRWADMHAYDDESLGRGDHPVSMPAPEPCACGRGDIDQTFRICVRCWYEQNPRSEDCPF